MRVTLALIVVAIVAVYPLGAAWAGSAAVALMAKTAYYEARSDGYRGMLAVCWVIQNRLRQQPGATVARIVRQRAQFSVWNRGSLRTPSSTDPHYVLALRAARQVLAGAAKDPTNGATYYHERSMRPPPAWARGMRLVARIGRHLFFKPRGR